MARYKDLSVVDKSTSGGTFTAFADFIFAKDGVMYGVGYDENMLIRHFQINSSEKNRIAELRGSKYVQSDLKDSFKLIKENLVQGKEVCFFGTPCQAAGLKSYLKKDYENLVVVDFVCRGVASPFVFKKYVEYQREKFNAKPIEIRFRNKTYGYHSGTMLFVFENGKKYYGSGRVDHMLKSYFAGACSRYSCYQCPYKGDKRCSDITVFDSWHSRQLLNAKKDDDRGFTNVFVRTEKGKRIINEMSEILTIKTSDPIEMKRLDGVMIEKYPKMHDSRSRLVAEIQEYGFYKAMQKNLPVSKKDILIERMKGVLHRMGILSLYTKK